MISFSGQKSGGEWCRWSSNLPKSDCSVNHILPTSLSIFWNKPLILFILMTTTMLRVWGTSKQPIRDLNTNYTDMYRWEFTTAKWSIKKNQSRLRITVLAHCQINQFHVHIYTHIAWKRFSIFLKHFSHPETKANPHIFSQFLCKSLPGFYSMKRYVS